MENKNNEFLMFYGTFISINSRNSPQNDDWKMVIDIPDNQKEEIKKAIDLNKKAVQVLIRLDPNISKNQNTDEIGSMGVANEGLINQSKEDALEDLPFGTENEVNS